MNDQLISFIEAGYSANLSSITSAHGFATFTFVRSFQSLPSINQEQGPDLASGEERRRVEWWMDGVNRRTDEDSLPLEAGAVRFGGEETHLKSAWDAESRIYVDSVPYSGLHAYINFPRPSSFAFVRGVTAIFDPLLFFKVDNQNMKEWLDEIKTPQMHVTILQSKNDLFEIHAETPPDVETPLRLVMTIDGRVGFNITRLQEWALGAGASKDPFYDFTGKFARSSPSAPFFPVDYHLKIFIDTEHKNLESLEVQFQNVSCNMPIDPITFTFKGMGLPAGVRLTDMRADPPLELRYGVLSEESLDKLVAQIPSLSTTALAADSPATPLPKVIGQPAAPTPKTNHLVAAAIFVALLLFFVAALAIFFLSRRMRTRSEL
jgi:hypothetical protein